MSKPKYNPGTGTRSKKNHFDAKRYATKLLLKRSFNKETEKSLIDEIEEICAFEDSLKD
jgi:hypothetical protein